jgi:type IV pilus assembly protein PilB
MQRAAAAWRPIGTVLVEAGAIDESQLEAALAEQKQSGRRLGEILIDSGAITWNALAHAIAVQVQAIDETHIPEPQPEPQPVVPAPAPPPPPVGAGAALPSVTRYDVGSENRLEAVEAMLRERQRAFLELVSTTETLRRAVAKLQDEVAEKDAEITRLRLQSATS